MLRLVASLAAALVIAAPLSAQTLPAVPELPRTAEGRAHDGPLAFRGVDGFVKLDRHFYSTSARDQRGAHLNGRMAFMLAGAFMQTTPVIRVLGVGNVEMDVATSTLAEAQAQGYRAYVGTAAGIVVTTTCTGAVAPFVCRFPLSQIQAQLSATAARPLAVASFLSGADGERESARATAPFTLQLAAPPVGPTGPGMRVRPPE